MTHATGTQDSVEERCSGIALPHKCVQSTTAE